MVSMWLLSLVLALGLILGQTAEAGPVEDHHPETSIEIASNLGQETTPAPACHPGLACTVFVVSEGPVTALSLSIVITLRPDPKQSQRRFGGPSVTLPPPRTRI
ncbi:hypothetical protein CUR21_05700 [Pseudorhodobacter sp. MZDSW-24AT]|nr:hypothetical protein CUR21_05700 [Pseudorhodobacter sp. MZDSW-24AT]